MTSKGAAASTMLGILTLTLPFFGQAQTNPAVTPGNGPQPDVAAIVAQMTSAEIANHASAHSYIVLRQYQLWDAKKGDDSISKVVARISYVPPGTKQYSIRDVQGSGSGERIVRRVLEHEAAMASVWWETALTDANYEFQLLDRENLDGHDCFVLALHPKREDKDLIRGRTWVDAESFHVRRIEGQPNKSPSWWVKRLQITLQFSQVMGMWLQTGVTARAELHLFGEHTLTTHDLQYETTGVADASAHPKTAEKRDSTPASPANSHSAPIVGAGVLPIP